MDGRFEAARVRVGGGAAIVRARAAVLAAGGFESNLEWLREAWGDAADNFIIRGTPYNKGGSSGSCSMPARSRSAIRAPATRSRSMPARRSSTAAS